MKDHEINGHAFISHRGIEESNWSPFTQEEIDRRLEKLRNLMVDKKLDAVFLQNRENINYYTGLYKSKFSLWQSVYISHDEMILITSKRDAMRSLRLSFADILIYDGWKENTYFKAVEAMLKAKFGRKKKLRLGIEQNNPALFIARSITNLSDNKQIEYHNISAHIEFFRLIKSDMELEHMRMCAAIARFGARTALKYIKAGIPENEVSLHVFQATMRELSDSFPFVEFTENYVWLQSGDNLDGINNPLTNDLLRNKQMINLGIILTVGGYNACLRRTLFIEDFPTGHHEKIWQQIADIHSSVMDMISVGQECKEVVRMIKELYDQYDLTKFIAGNFGHSAGIMALEHMYGQFFSLSVRERQFDDEVRSMFDHLQHNMIISLTPTLLIPVGESGAGSYIEEDMVIMSTNGIENITLFPYGTQQLVLKND